MDEKHSRWEGFFRTALSGLATSLAEMDAGDEDLTAQRRAAIREAVKVADEAVKVADEVLAVIEARLPEKVTDQARELLGLRWPEEKSK